MWKNSGFCGVSGNLFGILEHTRTPLNASKSFQIYFVRALIQSFKAEKLWFPPHADVESQLTVEHPKSFPNKPVNAYSAWTLIRATFRNTSENKRGENFSVFRFLTNFRGTSQPNIIINSRITARDQINRTVSTFTTLRSQYTDNHVNCKRQLLISSLESHKNRKSANDETQTLTERRGIDSQMELKRKNCCPFSHHVMINVKKISASRDIFRIIRDFRLARHETTLNNANFVYQYLLQSINREIVAWGNRCFLEFLYVACEGFNIIKTTWEKRVDFVNRILIKKIFHEVLTWFYLNFNRNLRWNSQNCRHLLNQCRQNQGI